MTDNFDSNTGKNKHQAFFELIGFGSEQTETAYMGSLFVMLSNVDGFRKVLDNLGHYLFPVAFGLKAFDWVLYFFKYLFSSNKNLGKTSNLITKSIATTLVGLAVFGGTLIGIALVPILFSVAVGIDMVINFGKFCYFAHRARKTKDPVEKAYFLKKTSQAGIKTIVGAIALVAVLVTLLFAPHIALGIIAAVGIVAAVTFTVLASMSLIKRFSDYRKFKKEKSQPDVEVQEINKPKNQLNEVKTEKQEIEEVKNTQLAPLYFHPKENYVAIPLHIEGFFGNSSHLSKPIAHLGCTMADLTHSIRHAKEVLETQKQADNDSFIENIPLPFGQSKKRLDKIEALTFLEQFRQMIESEKIIFNINHLDKNNEISKLKVITINGEEFRYDNIRDLILQIDHRITRDYPGVFQSFFKEVGNVETLFKYTYKLLLSQEAHLKSNQQQEITQEKAQHTL